MKSFDVIVIGAGILGLATALKWLEKNPRKSILILDKEAVIAAHQTGHNSGVIHSGIYYKPNSLKAKNCKYGSLKLLQYCFKKAIPIDTCGKLIIATKKSEIPRLEELERRGFANGVPRLRKLDKSALKEIEPHAEGVLALHSPTTAIVDFTKVAEAYAKDIISLQGVIKLQEEVLGLKKEGNSWIVQTTKRTYNGKLIINCAGFYADRIAHLTDRKISPKQIIPFRGEYYEIVPEKKISLKV